MVLDRFMARQSKARALRTAAFVVILGGLAACAPRRAAVVVANPAPGPGGQVHAVTVLPSGHTWVTHASQRYAFHDGQFYRWVPARKHYIIVKAPHGAAVAVLPRGHKVQRVKGVKYHIYRGVRYKPTKRNGKTVYVVAKF
ncbi:MAG: DUF6515 family protein [Longimicrobiales bacterium]